jgi:hypothetical protein
LKDNNIHDIEGGISPALERLLAISMVADRHSESNVDYSFTSILTAFLIAQDPFSKWFQDFVRCENIPTDDVFVHLNIEPAMFEEIRTTSERRIAFEGKLRIAYSPESILGQSLQLLKKTNLRESSMLDVRHVMAAFIYGHNENEKKLEQLKLPNEKMSNSFLDQIKILYPVELSNWIDIHLKKFKTQPEVSFGKIEDDLRVFLIREYNELSFSANYVSNFVRSNPYLKEEFFLYPSIIDSHILSNFKNFSLLHISQSAGDISHTCKELLTKVEKIVDSNVTNIPLLELHELQQTLQKIVKQAYNVIQYAKNIVIEKDIYDALAHYLEAADYLQVVSQQLQEIGNELSKQDAGSKDKLARIISSIYAGTEELAPMLVAKLKKSADDLLKAILDLRDKIMRKESVDNLGSVLSIVVKMLRNFMTEIIRAIFELVSWIRILAEEKKKFVLNELTVDITMLQSEPQLVGTMPISFPKLSTPRMVLKFAIKQ